MFLSLEYGNLPHDVPKKWTQAEKSQIHGGGEGEVTIICLRTDKKIVAAIKVYTYDTRTRKMRAYREITALKVLNGKFFSKFLFINRFLFRPNEC